jgi:beta-lactam-binding protein with PASTA domain
MRGFPARPLPGTPQPQTVKVPSVVGLSRAEAIDVLVQAFFTPVIEMVRGGEPADVVVGQSPGGGATAVAGGQVVIMVSNGKAPPEPAPAEPPPGQEGDLPPGQGKDKGKGKDGD